ncbi:MAG TPA: ankyrin repeat domain-containing protein [Capsulimonadaceae bacterium]|jgi:hypothetical protein
MTHTAPLNLDDYRNLAKDLLKRLRNNDVEASDRVVAVRGETEMAASDLKLADAQFVVAREAGYASWYALKQHVPFVEAVDALDCGDIERLTHLIEQNQFLKTYRCTIGEWYESGYFSGATLLHHVAGNPIRRPLPANIVAVAALLVSVGFGQEAAQETVGLVLTSKQASEAEVGAPLIDVLVEAGATIEMDDPDLLNAALMNHAPQTAEALIARGAAFDIRHAAGLGRVDDIRAMLAEGIGVDQVEEALLFAAVRGEHDAAALLIQHGAKGDVLFPRGDGSRTALHEAANRGYGGIVELMLEAGADAGVVDTCYGGTAAGWAEHGGYADLATRLRTAVGGG